MWLAESRTHLKAGLKIPFLARMVDSQADATSAKILDSVFGFSLITPSQIDTPNLIDSLVNNRNGMSTR